MARARWASVCLLDQETGRHQRFRACLPTPLGGRRFEPLAPAVARSLTKAVADVARADTFAHLTRGPFRRALLHVEAIGSSWFEGIRVGHRRLEETVALVDEHAATDATGLAVLANLAAMEAAIAVGQENRQWTPRILSDIHRALLAPTQDARIGGLLRDGFVWIGGPNPERARYVAPPADQLPMYLDDLCAYMNRTNIDGISQASVAHAQFELIHPFPDGNGRVGRALIQGLLRQRGVSTVVPVPVSQVVVGNADAYIGGITAFRDGHDAQWISVFSSLLAAAADETVIAGQQVLELLQRWEGLLRGVRRDAVAHRVTRLLLERPVLTPGGVARAVDVSHEAARLGLIELASRGIVDEVNIGKKRRGYIAPAVLRLADTLEKRLRSRSVSN